MEEQLPGGAPNGDLVLLFSYFILETSIIGRMININPFDQPAVEQVKVFTKKVLS